MGDTIRALSEVVDKHGLAATIAIVAIAILVAFLMFHIAMLKRWAASNEAVAKSNNERMDKSEQRHDALLVAHMNQGNKMLEVNASQDTKLGKLHQLDVLVAAATDAAERVEEQAAVNAKQTELMTTVASATKGLMDALGSDPQRICKLQQVILEKFPSITEMEVRKLLAYFLKQVEKDENATNASNA